MNSIPSIFTILFLAITCFTLSACEKSNEKPITIIENHKPTENHKTEYPFYDFNFKITIYHEPIGVAKEIIYKYDYDNKEDLKVLYFNYFNEENDSKLDTAIEKSYNVDKKTLDEIFSIISKKVTPKYAKNYSDKEVPPPPTSDNEWESCSIELDLGFWDDTYMVTTGDTSTFYEVLSLLQYFKRFILGLKTYPIQNQIPNQILNDKLKHLQ